MSTTTTQPHSTSATLPARGLLTYEFTKRKRWGDLLLNELVDVIPFILSPTYKILYCGQSVTELLGWRDIDLLDLDFTDLLDSTDQERFRIAFEDSIRTSTEFDSVVRLKTNKSIMQYTSAIAQEVLFDIKFYPRVTTKSEDGESKGICIFAMASPYPSRNAAMLATCLDLRAENERLQQRVLEIRNRLPAAVPSSKNSPPSQAGSMYATSSLNSSWRPSNAYVSGSIQLDSDSSGAFSSSMMSEPFDSATINATDGIDFGKPLYTPVGSNLEEQTDDGPKKKKLKKVQNGEQYVCVKCGRTDSPEWRKGPLGPKTLCNACGLRWAKQMRRVEDVSNDRIPSVVASSVDS